MGMIFAIVATGDRRTQPVARDFGHKHTNTNLNRS